MFRLFVYPVTPLNWAEMTAMDISVQQHRYCKKQLSQFTIDIRRKHTIIERHARSHRKSPFPDEDFQRTQNPMPQRTLRAMKMRYHADFPNDIEPTTGIGVDPQ